MQQPSSQPISTRHFNFAIPSTDSTITAFDFGRAPQPGMTLTFPLPQKYSPGPMKRLRAVGDIDGEHSCLYKKKRRLRLFLITSRLSPQYSQPATNIVNRGSSKIAVWAKQKALGRNLLCKASILNRIRKQTLRPRDTTGGLGRMLVEQEREQEHLELANLTLTYGSHDTYTRMGPPPDANRSRSQSPPSSPPRPRDENGAATCSSPNDAYFEPGSHSRATRKSYLPLPPSPLGLSNYDAFDQEDDIPDPYAHLDEEYESVEGSYGSNRDHLATLPKENAYSDSNSLDPDEPVFGDYDQVDGGADAIWPGTTTSQLFQRPAKPPAKSPNIGALFTPPSTMSRMPPSNPALSPMVLAPDCTSPSLNPTRTPMSISPRVKVIPRLDKTAGVLMGEAAWGGAGPDCEKRFLHGGDEGEKRRQKRYMFSQYE